MIKINKLLDCLEKEDVPFTFSGDDSLLVKGFSSLKSYTAGTVTWARNAQVFQGMEFRQDQKIFLMISPQDVSGPFENHIVTENPRNAFFCIIDAFFAKNKKERPLPGEGSYISPSVTLGENVRIGSNCVLDGDIVIGDNTILYHNVVIMNSVKIGSHCTIQSGVQIGHDGFGWYRTGDGKNRMIPHFGGVSIGNHVFIGYHTGICRGTMDDTLIGNNVIIDGLCHIAHNVVVGENAVIVAGSLLYGSSKIGRNAHIASAIIRNQIAIGDDSFIGMGSVVVEEVKAGDTIVGVPGKSCRKK